MNIQELATLAELDLVVAAIHTRLQLSTARQTERILGALENPLVNVLAHPTARLIGKRGPISFDLDEVVLRLRRFDQGRCESVIFFRDKKTTAQNENQHDVSRRQVFHGTVSRHSYIRQRTHIQAAATFLDVLYTRGWLLVDSIPA